MEGLPLEGGSLVEGAISVEAVLRAGRRPVWSVIVSREKLPRGFSRIEGLAEAANVPIRRLSRPELESAAQSKTHGGVLAVVGERRFEPLAEMLRPEVAPFLVMIDGVEDPYNFGQAVRSVYAAGATGLLVRSRNWMSAVGIVTRASGGATELMPTAVVDSAADGAEACRRAGAQVVALDDRAETSLFQCDLRGPLLLVVGGEMRGITRSFKEIDHVAARIPYGRAGRVALGTVAAVSVAAFEVQRQRSGN